MEEIKEITRLELTKKKKRNKKERTVKKSRCIRKSRQSGALHQQIPSKKVLFFSLIFF
jgi:hypothetical protein